MVKIEEKKIIGKSIFFYKINCFLRNLVFFKVKFIFMVLLFKFGENLFVFENDWLIKKIFILIKVVCLLN